MKAIQYRQYASTKRAAKEPTANAQPLVSVIIPFLNEADVLAVCHQRVCDALATLRQHCEIVYVDDGSTDNSWALVSQLKHPVHQVRSLRLSRNFGKEAAMSAGMKVAEGRCVILLDADLQDPPEYIPAMVQAWQDGAQVVEMQRRERHGESWIKRTTAHCFYRFMSKISDHPITENVGDFRLMDQKVVAVINTLPERTRFMKGLLAWPGFTRKILTFDRDPRLAGDTKWNYPKLIHLALEGITSFSTKPLRWATMAGLTTSAIAFIMALVIFTKTLFWGDPVAGYPSTMLIILFLGGIQLLSIGVLGEYVGRLFIESKQRPLYVLMENALSKPTLHSVDAE
ncbi:glycosyltransferase family 2 protein [Marinomonas sp. M1K-6]|uniref:Glycosyltransferase family 2 protein n=1 Tax=Marinomonas profundi TaxID=2726122 RepID=A0A847R8N9_9GAMM|nr:glycosyltransferase family 2 protein [Marinomonas profundi]NLQ18436.1 glycosyltransferase family 2 protein [Marinomonas profundi]UDV02757.1 glycosyltransferase family 2 protein [Marinomonas profundi]